MSIGLPLAKSRPGCNPWRDATLCAPGSTDARALLVKTSLRYLNTLAAEAGDDIELRKELAAAYEKVADIQGQAYGNANTGQQREALTSYAQAIALLEPVAAANAKDVELRTSLAMLIMDRRSRTKSRVSLRTIAVMFASRI